MDLKIESRNVGMTPRWETEIHERLTGLKPDHNHITHARVTLTKNPHHKKGENIAEALIVLTLPPRHTVTSRKEAKTFEEAIRAAFSAAAMEIKKIREKKPIPRTTPSPGPSVGTISKLVPREATGFILQDGGAGEIFFHEDALLDCKFSDLQEGMAVEFTRTDGVNGPQAIAITRQPPASS